MTLAEWVRQALRAAYREEPDGDPGKKRAVVREAAAQGYPSGDAIHVAVRERHGIPRILSFDSAFDGVPGIARLGGSGNPALASDLDDPGARAHRPRRAAAAVSPLTLRDTAVAAHAAPLAALLGSELYDTVE